MKEKRSHSVFGTSYLATSGVIAALYVVLTLPFAQFAFGPIQFRLAEIMTVLPIFSPAAIPGLTIGCFLSNLLNPDNLGPIDIIFGSLATLLAATWTRSIFGKGDWLKPILRDVVSLIPPVLCNALIVGTYLTYLLADGSVTLKMIGLCILSIGASEAVVVYAIGLPFLFFLRRAKVDRLWNKEGNHGTLL